MGGPGAPGSCGTAAAGGRTGVSFTSPSSAQSCSSAVCRTTAPPRDRPEPTCSDDRPQAAQAGARPGCYRPRGATGPGGGGGRGSPAVDRVRGLVGRGLRGRGLVPALPGSRGGRGALRGRCPRGRARLREARRGGRVRPGCPRWPRRAGRFTLRRGGRRAWRPAWGRRSARPGPRCGRIPARPSLPFPSGRRCFTTPPRFLSP